MTGGGVLSAVAKGLDLYAAVVRDAPQYPLRAVQEYDEWFRSSFVTGLLKRLNIEGGRWKATPESHRLIGAAGKQAAEGCRQILAPVVNRWLEKEYPQFWAKGLEYFAIMERMQDRPEPEPMSEDDVAQVNILVTGEAATLQDHIDHHRRYVERNVAAGLQNAWTMERFLEAMTVPQGIVGFPFGNTRYSWKTHIARMIEGRSRAVFMAAVEFRALRSEQ